MTKKQLTEQCRELLHGAKIDEPLNEIDAKWLWDEVLYYHPNRTYSFEDVVSITPRHNWNYGNKNYAFEVLTNDGVKDFWSFGKCIANRPKSNNAS